MKNSLPNTIISNIIDNETIILKDGKLVSQAKASMSTATTTNIGAGRIATQIEVLNKQSTENSSLPAFVSVDDLKVLFGADFSEAGYKCIVSSTSTEIGEYIVKDSNLPKIPVINTRYVLDNPFGHNTPVLTEVEVKINGAWVTSGVYIESNHYYFISAKYKESEGIVIQTGVNGILLGGAWSYDTTYAGEGNDATTLITDTRVHIYKVGSKNTAKDYSDFKIIYSNKDLTDRGPESVKSSKLPANVVINTRYVLDNPFGVNETCLCEAEVYDTATKSWILTGWASDPAQGYGYGIFAGELQGSGIVVRTGQRYLKSSGGVAGGTIDANIINTAPCRIKCWKVGYNGPLSTTDNKGVVQLATPEEVHSGKSTTEIPKVLTVESLALVTTIGNQGSSGYKCIYSSKYTGTLGVNDIKDAKLPINVVLSSRYVLTNPFGISTPVITVLELYDEVSKKWSTTGYYTTVYSGDGAYMSHSHFRDKEGIIVQTGNIALCVSPSYISCGSASPDFTSESAQCRVHVWKVGNSDIPVLAGTLPTVNVAQYIFSTDYKSIMIFNSSLGFYHSVDDINIELHMADITEIPKGKYMCDGSLLNITSKQGKRLLSLSTITKNKYGIVSKNGFVNLPNMFHTDGRGYHPRFGTNSGVKLDDAIREISGELVYQDNSGIPASSFSTGGSTALFSSGRDLGYIISMQGGEGVGIKLTASNIVPTATENRPLSISFIPLINLGI